MVSGGAQIVPNKAKYLEDKHKAFYSMLEEFALVDNVVNPAATIVIPTDTVIKDIMKRFKALDSKKKGWQQEWRAMENEVRSYFIKRVVVDEAFKGAAVSNFASHMLQISSARSNVIEIKSGKGLKVSGKAKIIDAIGRPKFKDDEPICGFWKMEKGSVISGDGDRMDALAMEGGLPQEVKEDDHLSKNIIRAVWNDTYETSKRMDVDCFAPVVCGFLCCLKMSHKDAKGNDQDRIENDMRELASNMCCHPIVTFTTTFCPGNPSACKISPESIKEWFGAPKYKKDYVKCFSEFLAKYTKDHGKMRAGMMSDLKGCEGGVLRGAAEDIYSTNKDLIISTDKDHELKMKCDYLCYKISQEYKETSSLDKTYSRCEAMLLAHPHQANIAACTEYLRQTKGSKVSQASKDFAKNYMLVHEIHKQPYNSQSEIPNFLQMFMKLKECNY